MSTISPNTIEAANEWMRERIGQTVYRAAREGDCDGCLDNGVKAVTIKDEEQALRCATKSIELGYRYADLIIAVRL